MSGIEEAVEKYVATWEEPNAELRSKVIAELWSTDAIYRNQTTEYHGLLGIEKAVTEAYDNFVTQGYTFRVAKVDSNHDAVRYTWEMLLDGGEEPEAIGTQVVLLDGDGRMLNDHQFLDKAPAGMEE